MRSLRCICLIGLYTLILGAAMVCVGFGLARRPVPIDSPGGRARVTFSGLERHAGAGDMQHNPNGEDGA